MGCGTRHECNVYKPHCGGDSGNREENEVRSIVINSESVCIVKGIVLIDFRYKPVNVLIRFLRNNIEKKKEDLRLMVG